ncbi:hypothetical protein ACA910_015532 [Epithemia clementina (nom. ined.)]
MSPAFECYKLKILLVVLILAVGFLNDDRLLASVNVHSGHTINKPQQARVQDLSGIADVSGSDSLKYQPSQAESLFLNSGQQLGYHLQSPMPDGCSLWTNQTVAGKHHGALQQFRLELKEYSTLLASFDPKIRDLRHSMDEHDNKDICNTLELHPDGLAGIFPSGVLSSLPGGAGYVEPLLPPLRHPDVCFAGEKRQAVILNMGYLIHDFASLCRHKLHKHGRTVFFDLGASLDFHDAKGKLSPAIYITQTYQKFGFHFDHIYAYEVTPKSPTLVYQQVPDELKAAYHWYNVGVSANHTSSANPFKLLLENFDENDFVVVKLDIDTSAIEIPLAQMLLHDKRLHKLVDCFYFEHHVFLKQLAPNWKLSMNGTLQESLELFAALRQKGIAAHYWP